MTPARLPIGAVTLWLVCIGLAACSPDLSGSDEAAKTVDSCEPDAVRGSPADAQLASQDVECSEGWAILHECVFQDGVDNHTCYAAIYEYVDGAWVARGGAGYSWTYSCEDLVLKGVPSVIAATFSGNDCVGG